MISLRHLLCGLLALCCATSWAQDDAPAKPAPKKAVELKDSKDRASYGIGRNIGDSLKNDGLDVDVTLLARGIADALAGTENPQTEEEFRDAITAFQKSIQDKAAAKNEEFLKANAKKEGVKSLPSGLQYQVLKEGKGKKPTAKDTVEAHYKGTLLSGKVFDSSYDRGEPAQFPLSGVIKGWTEGVPLMQVGAKYKFWIPSDLAYGPRGRPPVIAPNSVLIFEIELLKVIAEEEGGDEPEPQLKVKKKIDK
ncbi:MAG: FKBP-type peptidyl-prolyl cis-trans isomerase [Planctomycetota bacterium]|nr:FKBP-type peptidyl-prolyl cis-trans isomerase [Planctomycetota bacterium]